jgi:hypothetical protein
MILPANRKPGCQKIDSISPRFISFTKAEYTLSLNRIQAASESEQEAAIQARPVSPQLLNGKMANDFD